MIFGSALRSKLDSAKGKTDRQIEASRKRIIQKWIPEAAGTARTKNAPKQFKDPAAAS